MLLQGERPGGSVGLDYDQGGLCQEGFPEEGPCAGIRGREAPSWETCPSAHPYWLKCPLPLPSPTQSHRPEKEWPVRSLKVYLGVKKKLRPPTW